LAKWLIMELDRKAGSVKRPELLANFWQKNFSEQAPGREKVRIASSFIDELMVGLGGLEPPASPSSGAFDRARGSHPAVIGALAQQFHADES